MNQLKFKKLSENAILPTRANPTDAGLDLYAAKRQQIFGQGHRALIETGVSVEIPEGHYGRIAPRSSLALNHGVDVMAGVVDASYRGPVGVVLINHGEHAVDINPGDRIAQLIIEKIETPVAVWAEDLDETERGEGGFGSTGA
jgi:dUTP pyrophosphatase